MAKYKRTQRPEDDEKSYSEEFEEEAQEQERQRKEAEEPDDAEERTYKKRYGDLRRHQQQEKEQDRKRIADLERQLEDASKKQIRYPKTDEEIEEWTKQYPDVAAIIDTIASKRVSEAEKSAEEQLRGLREFEERLTRKEAEQELMRLHPDFGEIRKEQEFHDWAQEQPKWVQDALYVNSTDPYACARAIDLYKADTGKAGKKKRRDDDDPKDAARTVSKSRANSPDAGGRVKWSESKVKALSEQEFEKHEDEILKAMRDGKFDYDISGGAR